MKIGPVDSEIALLIVKKKEKKKKLSQAKYIARSASLPSGLNNRNFSVCVQFAINHFCLVIILCSHSNMVDVA